jgi:hypothetical protein
MLETRWIAAASSFAALMSLAGCAGLTIGQNTALVGGTAGLGITPSNDLEQIYYLGVFDPRGQVPETIYRVRVRGQASALNKMKFASGWVHADLIDSLGAASIGVPKDLAGVPTCAPEAAACKGFDTGRRLVMFGPEGFREAPRDHRLVVVMGSSPDAFFSQMDSALGTYVSVRAERDNQPMREKLMKAMLEVRADQQKINDLRVDFAMEGVR